MNKSINMPNSWSVVKLADIATAIQYGYTTSAAEKPVGPRFLRITDIQDNNVDWNAVPFCKVEAKDKSKYLLKQGDIVFARTGATVGKSFLIKEKIPESVFASYLIRVRLKPEIESRYIDYFFKSSQYWKQISESQAGIGQPNVNGTKLAQLQIPLAPLEQQRSIVAEIEKQFSRLDEAVANLKRVKANLKRYKAAVLKAAVEGTLTAVNGLKSYKSWKHQPIDVAIESLDQGWSPRCENEPSDSPAVWGVIKTTAVQSLRFLEIENKRLPAKLKPRPHLELSAGDLLITRAGPRTRVGVACLVKTTRSRLINCDKVYRLRAKSDIAIPSYLELVLNAPHIVDELDELKTGISDSGLNLTQKRFRELIIPIPPLAEQVRIVAEVEQRLSVTEEVEATSEVNVQRAERLRQTILAKAFSGGLSQSN